MTEPRTGHVRLEGSDRLPVLGAARVGPADPDERLTVSVRLRRRLGAPPLPDLSQLVLPSGGRLSREEFGAAFGAGPADIARVEGFADEHGLAVEQASIPRRTVVLAGTVAQMSGAFRVDLGRYQVGESS